MIPKIGALSPHPKAEQDEFYGLPSLDCEMVPVEWTHSALYWALMCDEKHDILRTDPLVWYLDDVAFQVYAERLSSVPSKVILAFDSPFTYEKPSYFPDDAFENFVLRRAEVLHEEVKKRNPKAKLISPAISGGVGEQAEHRTVAFLVNHGDLFDGFAVHCFGELRQRDLAHLSKLIGNVLAPAPKPVWVTHWAVSAGLFVGQKPKGRGYFPPPMDEAARRLTDSYRMIDTMCHGKTHWFYAGLVGDIYAPYLKTPSDYSDPQKAHAWTKGRAGFREWDEFHFMGLSCLEGLKKEVLEALNSLE